MNIMSNQLEDMPEEILFFHSNNNNNNNNKNLGINFLKSCKNYMRKSLKSQKDVK